MTTFRTKFTRVLQGLTIALGTLSLLAYLAAAVVSQYPREIAAALGTLLGISVQVEQAQANWHPLTPGLRLTGITLGSGNEKITVDRAIVGLDFSRLLQASSPNFVYVALGGLKLHLVREPGNRLHVLGLPQLRRAGAAPARFHLPVQLRLTDTEVVWDDRKHLHPPLHITPMSFEIGVVNDHLRIAAFAQSPHGGITIAAELAGDITDLAWSGRSRIVADRLDLAALLGDYLPDHYRLSDLIVNGDVEITWESATPVAVQGRVDMEQVELAGDATMQFEQVGAQIAFVRQPKEWRLELLDLNVTRDGRSWPAAALAVRFEKTASTRAELKAATDFLRLQDVAAIVRVRSPWPALNTLFGSHAVQGDLHDARLDLAYDETDVEWRATATLSDFGSTATNNVPGVENLSGSLRAQTDHVQFELDSQDLKLDFGGLFRAPLKAGRAVGRLDWRRLPGTKWELSSDDLQFSNTEVSTRSRLRIEAPLNEPLFVNLRTDFSSPDVSIAGHYYPTRIMRPSLVRWLDRGIVSGSIPRGSLAIFGPIRDFPFAAKRNGHFEVLFDVEDMLLDYREEWPPLTDMSAEVRFHGLSLEIATREARIYESRVDSTIGRFESLYPASPLVIKGVVSGPLADEIRLLRESPLRKSFSAFTQNVIPSGEARLKLDLAIPMRKVDKYTLDGDLQFLGAGLDLKEWTLPLTNIHGNLSFDLQSLQGQGLRARGLNSDLIVDVATIREGTRVAAKGQFDLSSISARIPQIPLQKAQGASGVSLGVTIPHSRQRAGTPVRLDIQSDLRGIAIDVPQPLGKTRKETRPLRVQIPLDGDQRTIRVSYANQLQAIVAGDLSRGELRFGAEKAQLPTQSVFNIRGEIPEIDIREWIGITKSLGAKDYQKTLPDLNTSLKFGRITYGDVGLTDVRLNLILGQNELRGDLTSSQVNGRFDTPFPGYDPVNLDLDSLKFRYDIDDIQAEKTDTSRNLDPRDWPSLNLRCAELVINDAELGQFELNAASTNYGLDIDKLSFKGDSINAHATGAWRHANEGVATELTGTFATANLGQLLAQLGYARQLDGAGAKAEFDVHWPGDPGDFAQRNFTGHLDLELDQGRFLEIDPGVGRIVGLLNFNALQRRLRLDFSDLFKKGLSFDQITGSFTLDEGQAYTNDLTMEGPSGKIELAGRTGLATRDVDQLVTVTPKLDATLPVAGAIAGGPIAGVAVLVAQKLMSKQVDELNHSQYSIRGPWADATVKLESSGSFAKLFNSQNQDSVESAKQDPEITKVDKEKNPTGSHGEIEQNLRQLPPTEGRKATDESQNNTESLGKLEKLFKGLGFKGNGLDVLETLEH